MKKLYTINTNEAEVFMEVIYNPFLVSFKAENPDIDVKNIIDDSLLNDTRLYGGMTTAIANRMLSYAKAAEYSGADGVLVTCTSVNNATKMIRPLLSIPILNIEEPVAEMAVSAGTRIGVLATIPTSPKAIIEVIQEKAAAAGKNVTIVTRVADGAFDVLKSGDRERHDEMVAQTLYAHLVGFLSPDTFTQKQSVLFLTMLIFGGTTSFGGPLIGVVSLMLITESIRAFTGYQTLVYGVIIILVVVLLPKGVFGEILQLKEKLRTKKKQSADREAV